MRNYANIDRYLNILARDIYRQPQDPGHTGLARKVIDTWMSRMTTCKSVLDVGCGEGFCQPMFERWGIQYEGVCLAEDFIAAQEQGRNVKKMDFSFLEYGDGQFDLVFARHSLEHSPMAILTLFEWERVARNWLGIVLPHPEWYGYFGKNHYSVMNHDQILNALDRAGLKVLWDDIDYLPHADRIADHNPEGLTPHEMWLMCEKKKI